MLEALMGVKVPSREFFKFARLMKQEGFEFIQIYWHNPDPKFFGLKEDTIDEK